MDGGGIAAPATVEFARQLIKAEQLRRSVLEQHFTPAEWQVLLELFVAVEEGRLSVRPALAIWSLATPRCPVCLKNMAASAALWRCVMLKLSFLVTRAALAQGALLPREAALALGGAVGDQPARPERLRHALSIILPIALLVWIGLHNLTLVMSASVDAWVVRPAPGPIAKGELVSFALRHPLAGPEPVDVTKRVLCIAGETLRRLELVPDSVHKGPRSAFLCNGRLLGITRPYGHSGQRLTPFAWDNRPIPTGSAYLGSDHSDGFDSRYFGLVRVERLTHMERVL